MQLRVRVQPKSSRNRIRFEPDGRLKIYVTAPPTDGAANDAVCRVLADALNIGPSSVRVVRGGSARDKQLAVEGLTPDEVDARLRAHSES